MINANELRVGNYVGIGEIIDAPLTKIIPEQCGSYEPILITPDILKSIGNPKDDGWLYLPNKFRVCCAEVTGLCNFSMGMTQTGSDDVDWFIVSLPDYLHQLQNVYFALSGRELVIDL